MSCKFVFVRSPPNKPPLSPAYSGPFLVLRRSPRSFLLQIGPKTDSISIHRLKPANLPPGTEPASPPKRGRPPSHPLPNPPSILKTSPPPPNKSPPSKKVSFLDQTSSRQHKLPSKLSDFIIG
jgi:hypothetical protein